METRRYKSLEDLIQGQFAELSGSPGIVVVQPDYKRLDAYLDAGSGLDLTNGADLEQLKWVLAKKEGTAWLCRALEENERQRFIGQIDETGVVAG